MKKVFMVLIILFFGLCLPIFTFADVTEENPLLPDFLMPGVVESTGTHFEVNSDYLNIVLESSAAITLRLESVPEMVTMHIESASDATSTQITISGFQPSTTYYKYEDDYHNEVAFATDENGGYSWTQDLSQPHLVFIQPRKSTKFIADNATGGDCYLIGIWDPTTKTCTLTTDVYETIQIDSNYITLDGNGHTVTGTGTGNGVYLSTRTGVTIKNLNVKNFTYGIYLLYSSNNTLTGNTVSNNYQTGIYLEYSSNNTITNNIASNNYIGIHLYFFSSNNTLTNNNADSNNIVGIWVYHSSINNTITNNTASNNIDGISLCYSSSNNTITGNTVSNNYKGIVLINSNNNTITNNTASNNIDGIIFYARFLYEFSNNNQIYNNNFINNYGQVSVSGSDNIFNIFNLGKPVGGNYWSDFDTHVEGCYDTNSDGFCDAPYYFYGGVDYLPWTRQSGWEVPADTTPPVISIFGVKDGDTYALGTVPKASYTATDATSGIATSSDSLTGGDGFGLGTFTYSVTASDNAGNTATQTVTYTVIATIDGLTELINQFLISGAVDNTGIANSLLSKINNALTAESSGNGQASDNIMQAFINQISAQAGQHISASAAAILINAATYITNN